MTERRGRAETTAEVDELVGMSDHLAQARTWRRALVLHALCLGCFDAGCGLRRMFDISRIRAEGLNMCEFEPCPNGWKAWHRR